MNIPKFVRHLTGVVILLLAACQLSAQDTRFIVNNVTADAGEDFSVRVSATEFQDVVGVQMSLSWDTEKLTYLGVDSIFLDGTPQNNFNRTQLDSGRIGYLVIDPAISGFGVTGTVHLFSIKFRPVSNISMTTEIKFADQPLPFSAMDNRNNSLDCGKQSGMIELDGINSLITFAEDPRLSVSPNPFTEELSVNTNLRYAAQGHLEIRDLSGRLLKDQAVSVSAGSQRFVLPARFFPSSGAYLIRLVTDREQLSRKVVYTAKH